MNKNAALVLPFNEIDKGDIAIVGGKGANLGEMFQAGFPIPNGFCVTAKSYQLMLTQNNLTPQIKTLLTGLDVHNSRELDSVASKIQKIILKAAVPKEVVEQVFSLYRHLKPSDHNPLVAVRSSATAEDLPDASFAGQQETFLNIKGEANLIEAIRKDWASLFGARAIFYRATKGFDHFKVSLAIPVQLMIQSAVSGVMFSVNPVTNNKDQIVIEAVWGLGDYIVQGVVTPDHYIVDRADFHLHSRLVSSQEVMEVYEYPSGVKQVKVDKKFIDQPKLTDEQVIKLAKIGHQIHKHYFFPQDMEWAIENDRIYITQSRPITTLTMAPKTKQVQPASLTHLKVIVTGAPASPGIASGKAVIVKSLSELGRVKDGDVLVAPMTSPDYVPAMKKAVGIVTDKGGQTSHAAIVSRELGLPAVVGTKNATSLIQNGDVVTIDGANGHVYSGTPKYTIAQKETKENESIKTATKVYVNLAEPDLAGITAQADADGVGLLRAEFMIAQIGIHPKKLIRDHHENVFVSQLAAGLVKFAQSFGDRPVVYRATDFKTNEYRNLKGGKDFEPFEPNPMLGYRGAFRYISDESVFRLELEAIKIVRNKFGFKNLWLMIPFCRTPAELLKVKQIVSSHGLSRSSSFKLWMMVEIPSNVILLEEFIAVGIDGVSIGSNDLTMLILGTDRDNESVASVYDERNPAILWALEKIIKTGIKMGITVGICGQAPSEYSDLTTKLVEWGITSVSVSPDAIDRTRQIVAAAEKRLLRK